MTDVNKLADTVLAFHKRLTDGGLTGDLADVLTIETHKALLAGGVVAILEPTRDERQAEVAAAAAAKAARREAELARLEGAS